MWGNTHWIHYNYRWMGILTHIHMHTCSWVLQPKSYTGLTFCFLNFWQFYGKILLMKEMVQIKWELKKKKRRRGFVSTVAFMFSWLSLSRNATSQGVTYPVRTFVQPAGKTLQTLLGFVKKEMDSCPTHWRSPQTLSAPRLCLGTVWDRGSQHGPEVCQGMC